MELIEKETSQVAAYTPFYAQLATLEKDNSALVFDYESKKGNKEARSHVFALRKTKSALEATRVEAKAESLRVGRAVDFEAKEISARIEAMITVHQAEIDKIEQREKDRVAALQKRLAYIEPRALSYATSNDVRKDIAHVEAITIMPDWEEFMAQAASTKDTVLKRLAIELEAVLKREAEAVELARLRAETIAREQADRDAAIAKAAAEQAQREAAEKAAQEAAKAAKAIADAKAEADRKEAAAALALKQERERALAEQEAAALRESQLKIQAQQAEQRRIAAEQQAEQERKDAIARAEKQAADAVVAEQERVAAAKRAEDAETAKRERNRAHKAAINNAALESLIAGGVAEECAKAVVTLIAQGKVENVSIAY